MEGNGRNEDWEGIIREMIIDATECAPTELCVYKMPCGECIVDDFLNAEGQERWLVVGDARSYTRDGRDCPPRASLMAAALHPC